MLLFKKGGDHAPIILTAITLLHSVKLTSADTLDTDAPWSARIGDYDNSIVEASSDESIMWHPLLVRGSNTFPVSSVVCRELGMGPPVIQRGVAYTSSPDDVTIFCDGSEDSIDSCQKEVTSGGTVYMLYIGECLPLLSTGDYDIALSRSDDSSSEGVLLVYLDGQWQPICKDSTLRDTACHQLGFDDQHQQTVQSGREFPGISTVPYFACGLGDESLSQCSTRPPSSGSCRSSDSYLKISCERGSDFVFRFPSFPFWMIGVGVCFLSIWVFRYLKHRSLQNSNNAAGTGVVATSVPVTTTQQNTYSTADYPRGQGLSPSQGLDGSADSPPAYPAFGDPAYPPPPMNPASAPPESDPHLPSYDQAVSQQK